MKNFIKLLKCPYCGAKFKRYPHTLVCSCDEFPIIEDILCLDKSVVKRVVDRQQKNDSWGALAEALGFGKRRVILRLLMWMAKKNIYIYWLWGYKKHEWNYYINRHLERESELFWWPTLIKNQKLNVWLDIGSGFGHNHQKLLKKYPGTAIYSVENSFKNLLLSKLIYKDNSRLCRVCVDLSETGAIMENASIDVVTVVDVWPFIKHHKKIISTIVNEILKKDGVFVATSIPEHVYLDSVDHYYPMTWQRFRNNLPKRACFFDEAKILEGRDVLKSMLAGKNSPTFRYSVIWPAKMPDNIKFTATNYWDDAEIKWKNKVY